jgi:hypothetical protein
MKITDKRSALSPLIEGGDWIITENGLVFMVIIPVGLDDSSGKIALIDMETGEFYVPSSGFAWFNHPQHMRNHLKKHFETYKHIKNKQLEVIIHEKTFEGF